MSALFFVALKKIRKNNFTVYGRDYRKIEKNDSEGVFLPQKIFLTRRLEFPANIPPRFAASI